MDIAWYLVLSAFIFCIGAAGVLTRRNPLVVLLCLELMLNAGNLALIAFSRMWGNGDGQVFALIVMVVAACEVVIGLGLIVAMYRDRLPIDVDEMSELQRMSADHLRLARARRSRSRGSLVIALGWQRAGAAATRRLDRQRRDRRSRSWPRSARCSHAPGHARRAARSSTRRCGPTRRPAGINVELGDPGRPAVGLHVPGGVGRVVPDPRLLGRLHGRATAATRASSPTSTSSSSRCCCWCWRATSCC